MVRFSLGELLSTTAAGPSTPPLKPAFEKGCNSPDSDLWSREDSQVARFVFFDYAGTKNEAAKNNLRQRSPTLREELATFAFTDPGLANWPLAEKQAEVQKALAAVSDDTEAVAEGSVESGQFSS